MAIASIGKNEISWLKGLVGWLLPAVFCVVCCVVDIFILRPCCLLLLTSIQFAMLVWTLKFHNNNNLFISLMANSGENSFKSQWRESLLLQLHNRNKQECKCFEDLISYRKYCKRNYDYTMSKKVNITSMISPDFQLSQSFSLFWSSIFPLIVQIV